MARIASLIAVALLLVAAASALIIKDNRRASTFDLAVEPSPEPTHHHDPDAGRKIYELALRFIDVVSRRDYTGLDMLLDSQFQYINSDAGCEYKSKSDFMDLIRNDYIASEVVTIQGWTESANMGVFRANVFGILNTTAEYANATFSGPKVYLTIVPTADYMRIGVYQQYSDRSWAQTNATAMVNVFKTLINASEAKDITPWQNALTSDFAFQLWEPFSPELPKTANRTETLAFMGDGWSHRTAFGMNVLDVFAVCNMVLAEFDIAEMRDDGRAMTNHFFYSMSLTPSMQVSMINEFPTRPLF